MEGSYPVNDNGGQNLHKPRRLRTDDKSCCQLDGFLQVPSVHHQYMDIRSLHVHQ